MICFFYSQKKGNLEIFLLDEARVELAKEVAEQEIEKIDRKFQDFRNKSTDHISHVVLNEGVLVKIELRELEKQDQLPERWSKDHPNIQSGKYVITLKNQQILRDYRMKQVAYNIAKNSILPPEDKNYESHGWRHFAKKDDFEGLKKTNTQLTLEYKNQATSSGSYSKEEQKKRESLKKKFETARASLDILRGKVLSGLNQKDIFFPEHFVFLLEIQIIKIDGTPHSFNEFEKSLINPALGTLSYHVGEVERLEEGTKRIIDRMKEEGLSKQEMEKRNDIIRRHKTGKNNLEILKKEINSRIDVFLSQPELYPEHIVSSLNEKLDKINEIDEVSRHMPLDILPMDLVKFEVREMEKLEKEIKKDIRGLGLKVKELIGCSKSVQAAKEN